MGWQHKLTQTFSVAITLVVVAVSVTALAMLSHGGKFLSVQSGSMVPTFHKGDLVIDAPLDPHIPLQQQLAVGDVVTYSNPGILRGQPVTHRIVQTASFANGNHFITRGDANPANDPPITARDIIGKVGHSLPYTGYAADFVRKPLGLVLLIYIPALLVIIGELRRLAKYYKEQEPYRLVPVANRETVNATPRSKVQAIIPAAILLAVIIAVPTVQAALRSSTILTASSISTITRPTTPVGPDHLLIYQVNFGSTGSSGNNGNSSSNTNVTIINNNTQTATSGNATASGDGNVASGNASNSSTTNISINVGGSNAGSGSGTPAVLPTVILYNPTAQAVNLAGYKLADNTSTRTIASGTIAAKGYFTYSWPIAGGLSRTGDRLVLQSLTAGIDSLSWGSDKSQLNPSVVSNAATSNVSRKSITVDTDTASDWQ